MGGSQAMPRAYQAIKEFVRVQESSAGSVFSCVITTGVKSPP
jgi:hypothetical protein